MSGSQRGSKRKPGTTQQRETHATAPTSVDNAAVGGLLAWLRQWENLLFALLVVIHLVPLWSFRYFATQDGPATIENANILRLYDDPRLPVFHEYFKINEKPSPNWAVQILLAGLMSIFPPLIAEKVLLSGYVLLFPLSVRYAIRSIRPESSFVAVLCFPFIYNYLLNVGFYNFVYSLAMFFFLVGCRIRHPRAPRLRHTILLATIATLLYFCHIVSLVMAIVALAVLDLSFAIDDATGREKNKEGFWTSLGRSWGPRVLWTSVILAPSLALSVVFLDKQGTRMFPHLPFDSLLLRLVHADSLVGHTTPERGIATAVAWFFLAILVYVGVPKLTRRTFDRWDGLFVIAVVYAWIYFIAPEGISGGSYMSYRLNLFPFFALILWFAAREYGRFARIAIQIIGVVLAVVFLWYHVLGYARLNDYLTEYTSGASLIEPNSTILPLCYAPFGRRPDGQLLSNRVKVFLHAAGYIAASRDAMELDNYQANTAYFPLVWRPELNPYSRFPMLGGGIESNPPCVNFAFNTEQTGDLVDYVLVWGMNRNISRHPCSRFVLLQLTNQYDLIHSSRRGLMRVFRRKGFAG